MPNPLILLGFYCFLTVAKTTPGKLQWRVLQNDAINVLSLSKESKTLETKRSTETLPAPAATLLLPVMRWVKPQFVTGGLYWKGPLDGNHF